MGDFIASISMHSNAFRTGYILLLWSKDKELEQILSQECHIENI